MGWGGSRPGAGRPPKTDEPAREYPRLKYFERDAVRGLRHRVPDDVHPVAKDLADHAFVRIVDVMDERVDPEHAANVLKAAVLVRDEICGPIAKKLEVKVGLAQLLADAAKADPVLIAEDVTPLLPDDVDVDVDPDPETRREKAPGPQAGG